MKPEFEHFRGPEVPKGVSPTPVRLPLPLKEAAELIAGVEGDSLSGLLIEGLARVVQDRLSGTDDTQRRLLETSSRLDALRSTLGLPPPPPDSALPPLHASEE